MNFDRLYAIGFASIFMVVVFGGLYRFKRVLRNRLFPPEAKSARKDAMSEILLLKARLEERASGTTVSPTGEEGEEGEEEDEGRRSS